MILRKVAALKPGVTLIRLELHVLPWQRGVEELEFIAKYVNGLIQRSSSRRRIGRRAC